MPYTSNPQAPKVRRDAAAFAKLHGVRAAARRFGVSPGTVTKWVAKAKIFGLHPIPTGSSRPKHHPNELPRETADLIADKRVKLKRSSEVVHRALADEGVVVSLSSVKRTLSRRFLIKKRSPWKRYHAPVERPKPLYPGALVEIDTIHTMISKKKRMYTFTLIDVYSRWAYAKSYARMNAATAVRFVAEAQRKAPFRFETLQSDHGPEFGKWFVSRIQKAHRYTRIGKPNDNAHIERFNRSIQEECLDALIPEPDIFNRALKKYLRYYNHERHHFGISLLTPMKYLECFQAID